MKEFFKMMFASALGVFVAIGLLVAILIFIMIGVVASISSSSSATYVPKQETVLNLKLEGTIVDVTTDNPFAALMGKDEKVYSLKDILYSIRVAKENEVVKGIYIESGFFSAGTASLESIRRALIDFKESGKFVIAYGDNFTRGSYFLSSVADKVFLNPQGILELNGIASQTIFYKGFLKKIGVDMLVFKVGTYKGAVEPFMLDKLSDANREQISSYIGGIWDNIVKGVAESRKVSVAEINRFANEGLTFAKPERAIEFGLIDELKYRADVEEYVKEQAGQTGDKLKTVGVDKMKTVRSNEKKSADKIAILYAEGEIVPVESSSPYDFEQTITEKVARELIKLRKDESVKAVVFRVNSPGGSAYTSDQIWHQVVELKKVKPVVVSMGNVAASGGYYISCAASKIVAEANTLTGSIGVFGIFPNATGLLDKLDITSDVVKTNHFADLGDATRPMRDDEKALIQSYVERTYDIFLARCADGRGISKDSIDAIGQGRVWTGEQAQKIGLVDELGGIDKAIEVAAGLAKVSDYEVSTVTTTKDFFQELFEKQFDEVKLSILRNTLGEEYEYFKTLEKAKSATGIQARIPYTLKPL